MGEDVFYSGTVAAAIEGALQGVPAIAASLVTRERHRLRRARRASSGDLVRQVLRARPAAAAAAQRELPVPALARSCAGVQITRLGSRVYEDTLVRKVDPRGRDYYWIGGEDPVWEPATGHRFPRGRTRATSR